MGNLTKAIIPYAKVLEYAHREWDSKGLCSISQKDARQFIFKFNSEAEMNGVLSRGTWYFDKKPMVLCALGSTLGAWAITNIPLWVKFSNIPDYYRTRRGLSHLASAIGNSLCADKLTTQLNPLPFAKMCVSYKIGEPLPDKLCVATMDPVAEGKMFSEVVVTYHSKPIICKGCNSLGHQAGAYPSIKRVWVLKRNTGETSGVKEGGTQAKSGRQDNVVHNTDVAPAISHTNDDSHDKGEWTTVVSKKWKVGVDATMLEPDVTGNEKHTPGRAGADPNFIDESPYPAITFRNLKRVDEIDAKRAAVINHTTSKSREEVLQAFRENKPDLD